MSGHGPVCGSAAEAYDRHRLSHPAAVADIVLEVGAGAGTATTLVARRGVPVTACEPDAAMAGAPATRLQLTRRPEASA